MSLANFELTTTQQKLVTFIQAQPQGSFSLIVVPECFFVNQFGTRERAKTGRMGVTIALAKVIGSLQYDHVIYAGKDGRTSKFFIDMVFEMLPNQSILQKNDAVLLCDLVDDATSTESGKTNRLRLESKPVGDYMAGIRGFGHTGKNNLVFVDAPASLQTWRQIISAFSLRIMANSSGHFVGVIDLNWGLMTEADLQTLVAILAPLPIQLYKLEEVDDPDLVWANTTNNQKMERVMSSQ